MEFNEQFDDDNPDEEYNEATNRSKGQSTTKCFGDDLIVHLLDGTSTIVLEAFESQDADY